MLDKIILPREIEAALEDGAALSISVSGGRDSDAIAKLLTMLHQERGNPWPASGQQIIAMHFPNSAIFVTA